MRNLHSAIQDLAQSFASDVLDAIKGVTLGDLHDDGGSVSRGRSAGGAGGEPHPRKRATRKPAGRLPRRSPEEIAKTLDQVLGLVKASKTGLRAEEIRAALKLDKREMPRVLGAGLRRTNSSPRDRSAARSTAWRDTRSARRYAPLSVWTRHRRSCGTPPRHGPTSCCARNVPISGCRRGPEIDVRGWEDSVAGPRSRSGPGQGRDDGPRLRVAPARSCSRVNDLMIGRPSARRSALERLGPPLRLFPGLPEGTRDGNTAQAAPSRGEPSGTPRGVGRSHDGSCEPFEVEARFGVLAGPGNPGDGVARAPGRVSRGQVDDVVAREGVGDRLGGGLG